MLKNILFLLSLCAASNLQSCSESVHTWKFTGADFKEYKTYAWAAPGDTTLTMVRNDKLFAGTIHLFANKELAKKGLVMVKARPDVVFMFDTQVEGRTRYEQSATLSVGIAYGGPGYYVGGMAPVAGGEITEVPYQEGRLIVEMFDYRSRQLVWRAWAQESLDNNSDISKVIEKAIKDMMFYLPVKQKIASK